MSLVLGGGDAQPGCGGSGGRTLRYDMVCDKSGLPSAPPNATMVIPGRKVDPIPTCTYVVEWHHPAACATTISRSN